MNCLCANMGERERERGRRGREEWIEEEKEEGMKEGRKRKKGCEGEVDERVRE